MDLLCPLIMCFGMLTWLHCLACREREYTSIPRSTVPTSMATGTFSPGYRVVRNWASYRKIQFHCVFLLMNCLLMQIWSELHEICGMDCQIGSVSWKITHWRLVPPSFYLRAAQSTPGMSGPSQETCTQEVGDFILNFFHGPHMGSIRYKIRFESLMSF